MVCPKCGIDQSVVLATRQDGAVRKRRYACMICGGRFNTTETVVGGSWRMPRGYARAALEKAEKWK